jgi:hypothetical protein
MVAALAVPAAVAWKACTKLSRFPLNKVGQTKRGASRSAPFFLVISPLSRNPG